MASDAGRDVKFILVQKSWYSRWATEYILWVLAAIPLGESRRNKLVLFLDSASAPTLLTPGMWTVEMWTSWHVQKKCRQRRRCMIVESLLELPLRISTTAMLSEWNWMCFACHSLPHTAVARTMSMSSFAAMFTVDHCGDQGHWNQFLSYVAPHPHEPEASVNTWKSGWRLVWLFRRDTPFHDSIKVSHHIRSKRNPSFNLIQWSSL